MPQSIEFCSLTLPISELDAAISALEEKLIRNNIDPNSHTQVLSIPYPGRYTLEKAQDTLWSLRGFWHLSKNNSYKAARNKFSKLHTQK